MAIGSVVVSGIVEGQRRALSIQKNNDGVSNIVAADQMSRFADANIGDAMKRIPGINVQYDQGEARFGQIRGTAPDLTSVTLNGNRLPSAEGDSRAAQLDLIPTDMIQTIEVHKVVTADMDGDAIGGSVNLVTKNSPYRQTVAATAGAGYNPVLATCHVQRFGKLGLALLQRQTRRYGLAGLSQQPDRIGQH